jgi:hypothetical protein
VAPNTNLSQLHRNNALGPRVRAFRLMLKQQVLYALLVHLQLATNNMK